MRIAEVDLDVGGQRKALMVRQLFAAIPGQRLVEFVRQLVRVLDEGVDDGLGIFAVDLREHDVAGLPFDQGGNLAIVAAKQEVTFPVTRQRTVVGRSGTLADGYRVGDSTVNAGLLRVVSGTA